LRRYKKTDPALEAYFEESKRMLKNIPNVIPPQLLAVLCEMGHADTIVLGDANFPAKTCAKKGNCEYIRMDGVGTAALLKAVISLIPLDYCDKPVKLMKPDRDVDVGLWETYAAEVSKADGRGEECIEYLERNDFYRESEKAFCIVQTGETAIYANIIIQKGVVE
jgi:L-fucose mutarotase